MSNPEEIYRRRIEMMQSNPDYAQFAREYGYDKCHYLTLVLAEKINAPSVALFYLAKNNRIIHSAAVIYDYAIDAFGKQPIQDILTFYDIHNRIMGKDDEYGNCEHFEMTTLSFDPNKFYLKHMKNLDPIRAVSDKWFTEQGDLRIKLG